LNEFEKELKQGFLFEAQQSITEMEQSFLFLETDPHNSEHINQIFRLAHNLKASSKAVGYEHFGQVMHQFESFVLRLKNNDLEANSAHIVKQMIQGLRNNLDTSFEETKNNSIDPRMFSVKSTFHKMQKVVHDTSTLLNKDISLSLIGEETELVKSIPIKINDSLVHLIRNSVDHGIESTQNRVARGKPAQGNITLKAFQLSGRLVLEVIDDGEGLDTEKLKHTAITKGILNETDVLSDSECVKLIFAPGFSTKAEVTELSGRGVGMDVVKTNIEKLGGEIQIESLLGRGTKISIKF
jgi:chemotaxis protein histidine kinase CheA